MTCLTGAFFLNDYTILRNNRTTENHKSKHEGALIAVKSIPHEQIFLTTKSEYVAIKVKSEDDSTVICCLYNPPKSGPIGGQRK